MAIINGRRGAFLKVVGIGEDQSGQYTLVRAEGTRSEIEQLIPQMRQVSATYDIKKSFSGAADVLEGRIPGPGFATSTPEVPIDDWETMADEVEKDLLECDIAGIDGDIGGVENTGLDDSERALIRTILDQGVDSEDAYRFHLRSTTGFAADLYNLAVYGVRAKRVIVPHLRHTQTVSQLWTVKAALTNVERIISTTSLVATESVPSTILFNLPDKTTVRSIASKLGYGWYKKYPSVKIAANRRMQIEQEWEYGLWSTVLYGAIL